MTLSDHTSQWKRWIHVMADNTWRYEESEATKGGSRFSFYYERRPKIMAELEKTTPALTTGVDQEVQESSFDRSIVPQPEQIGNSPTETLGSVAGVMPRG
jgi:hypothetical protein